LEISHHQVVEVVGQQGQIHQEIFQVYQVQMEDLVVEVQEFVLKEQVM
jgi:hypothetical protein